MGRAGQQRLLASDAALPTLGYVAVGLSVFALLASGPRLLGPDEYSELAVAWTVATVFGAGLAMPGEQAINHAYSRGESGRRPRVTFRLAGLAFALTALWLILAATAVNKVAIVWGLATIVALAGWVITADLRGKAAGRAEFAVLGSSLIAESVARLLLVALAWALPGHATPLLAAAIGVPLCGAWLASRPWLPATSRTRNKRQPANGGTQLSMTTVALALQVMLNGAPLWLVVAPGADPASAGIFVSIASYMRIPMLLGGGLLSVLLSRASADAVMSNATDARERVRAGLSMVTPISAVTVMALVALSPIGLRIIYGPELEPPLLIAVLMGTATVAVMFGTTATQGLFAVKRQLAAAVIWPIGALVTTTALFLLPPNLLAASLAVTIGTVAASAAAGLAVFSRRSHSHNSVGSTGTGEEHAE